MSAHFLHKIVWPHCVIVCVAGVPSAQNTHPVPCGTVARSAIAAVCGARGGGGGVGEEAAEAVKIDAIGCNVAVWALALFGESGL